MSLGATKNNKINEKKKSHASVYFYASHQYGQIVFGPTMSSNKSYKMNLRILFLDKIYGYFIHCIISRLDKRVPRLWVTHISCIICDTMFIKFWNRKQEGHDIDQSEIFQVAYSQCWLRSYIELVTTAVSWVRGGNVRIWRASEKTIDKFPISDLMNHDSQKHFSVLGQ